MKESGDLLRDSQKRECMALYDINLHQHLVICIQSLVIIITMAVQMDMTWPLVVTSRWDAMPVDAVNVFTTNLQQVFGL